jgi:hypothetical protein
MRMRMLNSTIAPNTYYVATKTVRSSSTSSRETPQIMLFEYKSKSVPIS